MAAERRELRHALGGLAAQALAALASRFHLVARDDGDDVVFESPRVRVRVGVGTGHVADLAVALGPPASGSDDEFGLGPVLEAVAGPRVAYASRPVRTEEELAAELRRAVALLDRHAGGVLEGDFGAWPALRRAAAEAGREWKRQFDAGGEATRVWQAREAAHTAYGQGDYRRAVALYESIADVLTPAESERLESARERS
jgi:hypothetical protein